MEAAVASRAPAAGALGALVRVEKPGRLVIVALNQPRDPARLHPWDADYPGLIAFADGAGIDELRDRGPHLDDWPEGLEHVPGPGVWVWEGQIVWHGGPTSDGEEWDVCMEGAWRRPNAVEAWALMRGAAPWTDATPGVT